MSIYLDWNATAPLRPEARAAWLRAQDEAWANPASVHAPGQQARFVLDQAKATIARRLGCNAHELVLTSGGTEANALALHQAQHGSGGGIVCSAIDHSSVLRAAAALRPPVLVPVDHAGRLLPDRLAEALASGPGTAPALVAFQLANNELGTLQDVPALVAVVRHHAPQALVLLDACQGAGKVALDLRALGVDLCSIAGHKFGAPKGVGLLYARTGLKLGPLLRGGRQQQDRRSGTEDPALACALAAALDASLDQAPVEGPRQRGLLDACFATIADGLPEARWLGRDAPRLANTLSLGFAGPLNAEVLVQRLDLAGVAVSLGAACMAGRGEPSHVITALGLDRDLARSVIRVSIGPGTTAEDLDRFAGIYQREVRAMIGKG